MSFPIQPVNVLRACLLPGKYSFGVSVYMLELYQDTLIDLLLPIARAKEPPRLDIKKDPKVSIGVIK